MSGPFGRNDRPEIFYAFTSPLYPTTVFRFDPSSGAAAGEPFRVTNYESPNQMILTDVRIMEMALAADRMVLPIMEVSGGIWILENVDR